MPEPQPRRYRALQSRYNGRMTAPFRRKRIRLVSENYLGKKSYFVTMCVDRRRRDFEDTRAARWIIERLRRIVAQHAFTVDAYCVMPDHVHVLARGTRDGSDLLELVSDFKRRAAETWLARFGTRLWQGRYYDHILRPRENAIAVCWYIWLNPVRKGICADPREYPFCGSFTGLWPPKETPALRWDPPWKQRRSGGFDL